MATAQIPEGGTYLDTFKGSFTKVPIDAENGNAISTTEFLDAAESLTTMFGTDAPRGAPPEFRPANTTCTRPPWLRRLLPRQEGHDGQRRGVLSLAHSLALSAPRRLTLVPAQKLRKRQLAAPLESQNIQDLVRNELKTKSHTATEGLLWLVR